MYNIYRLISVTDGNVTAKLTKTAVTFKQLYLEIRAKDIYTVTLRNCFREY